MRTLYLSLGTNLGARQDNLLAALERLERTFGHPLAVSSFWETDPWGFRSEHRFLNAVAAYRTSQSAEEILAVTQEIERSLGRTSKSHDGVYEDRLIDIDLLLLGEEVVQTPTLTLPHPHLAERRFVLAPLAEIAASVRIPLVGKTVGELLAALNIGTMERVTPSTTDALLVLQRLLPQLSAEATDFDAARLSSLLASPQTYIYLLRDELGTAEGSCTLCLAPSPTGCKAWLEDVVVDETCRGRGYGRQLVHYALEQAKALGAKSLNLTSRPSRVAANHLYQSLGFILRETNSYSYSFE